MDTLNLDDLAKQGEQYRRFLRRRVWRSLAAAAVLLALYFLLRINPADFGALYVFERGDWHQISGPFVGVPYQLRTASNHDIWLSTTLFSGLYRFDGKTWTAYDSHDFNTNNDDISSFTVQDNDVWAVVDTSIVHWNGNRWLTYPDVLRSSRFSDIAAGDFGVVAVTTEGQVARFDGQGWTVDSAERVLPSYATLRPTYPTLASVHGQVWLIADGLWRFDGSTWSSIGARSGPIRYLGADRDTLWLFDGQFVEAFNTTTEDTTKYDLPASLSRQQVYQLVTLDNLHYVATSHGMFTFDGQNWQPMSRQLPVPGTVPSLIVDGQARLWAALNANALTDNSFGTNFDLLNLVTNFTPVAIWLALILVYVLPGMRSAFRRSAAFAGRIPELLPDIQKYQPLYSDAEKAFRRRRLLYFLPLAIGLFLGLANASFLISAVVIIALMDLWCISPSLVRYFNGTLDDANRAYLRRNILVTVVMISYLGILIFIFLGVLEAPLSGLLHDFVVSTLVAVILALVVAYNLWSLTFLAPILWIYRGALARGDYQQALEQITALRRRAPKYLGFMFAHGFILLLAGHTEEAEPLWREILSEVQNGALTLRASSLVNLADLLNQQGRFAEALPLLMLALEMVPERGLYYRELANWYQLQAANPKRALELSEVMMRFSRRPRIGLQLGRYSWGSTLAVRALALAGVQRYGEVDTQLRQAFEQGDRQFKPGLAALYWHAAEIDLLQGKREAATGNFQKAIDLDTEGRTGQLARKRLSELM